MMARPKRFELLPPRFVVWAGPLKSLRFVTVNYPKNPETQARGAIIAGAVTLGGTSKTTTVESGPSGSIAPRADVRGCAKQTFLRASR